MPKNFIEIKSLDMEGRGVGHLENDDGSPGKVVFVEGALPGERVVYASYRKKPKWEVATTLSVERESAQRVQPKCRYFGVCGGCAMQHLDAAAQVAMKQRVLEDNLKHIGRVKATMILRPIHGPAWGYRLRARISIRNVPKKGGVLVGFHERRSSYITDMRTCDILPPHVSALLVPLRELIAGLSIVEQVPQIELAIGEGAEGMVTVMVLRIMATPSAADEAALKDFADRYTVQWWLQTAGLDTATQYYPEQRQLHYLLPEFGLRMPFKPTDFTQVNHHINRVLVTRAMRLLAPGPDDRVVDLFCGLGNFTLPLATLAREVVGIEGSATLTERALANARANLLSDKVTFQTRNLFEFTTHQLVALTKFDLMLIDPPREGAMAVCEALAGLDAIDIELKPRRIVYVSCNPATLARDAALLVNGAGYVLHKAGVINMFPHTAHVESIAVFDLPSSLR
ncbi:MAG: 23S rRNA (uracil(1939)-C(5))-methyltransferase RlmD [Pseudomonadota bacterium]